MSKVSIETKIMDAVCRNTKIEGERAQDIREQFVNIYICYINLMFLYMSEGDYNVAYDIVRMLCNYTDGLIKSGIAMETLSLDVYRILSKIMMEEAFNEL